MIIKETPWERRNLGVESSVEYYVDNSEYEELEAIWDSEYDYQVLHIASGNTKALLTAQDRGFRLIELNVRLQKSLEEVKLSHFFQRYEKVIDYRPATEDDIEQVLKVIRSGEMFLTDKIAMDPFFGAKHSGERYYQSTQEFLEKGAITVMCTYKSSIIGFEIYHENHENLECVNFIGGLFSAYEKRDLDLHRCMLNC